MLSVPSAARRQYNYVGNVKELDKRECMDNFDDDDVLSTAFERVCPLLLQLSSSRY